jgi:Family of unknown function (DUF6286)
MALFDRLAAFVVALAVLLVGVLVPAEILRTAVLDKPGHLILPWETLGQFLTGHQWSTSPILTISGMTAGVGLVLLLAELKRRRPGLLALSTEDRNTTAGTTRRSLQRALAAQAEEVDGVSSASAKIRRGRASVTATTGLRDPGDIRQRLIDQLTGWLDSLDLVEVPPLRTRLNTRER